MNRILVVRGGAIGDFILTLPALKVLRDAFPRTHIEILGYKHIAALAEKRFYAQAVRSIEYGPLSSFFAKNSEQSAELANYFASFDLIISYLYDPDRIFESAEDRQFAQDFLSDLPLPIVAIHPGSGSERKNWPVKNWIALSRSDGFPAVVISGEADESQTAQLEIAWKDRAVRFVRALPLPQLAAVLENTIFLGHDSGISHLAAAAGANCVLLFGPTDSAVWAPKNKNVRVLSAPGGKLSNLEIARVEAAVASALNS